MNAIRKVAKKIMAKETTSTFEITVTHRGNKKEFEKLFRAKGGQIKLETKMTSTKTVEGETHALYTNEQKVVRVLLKKCCEAAGLKYMGVKRQWGITGGYSIEYGYCRKNGTRAEYHINLHDVRVNLLFDNGLDVLGEIKVYDLKNPRRSMVKHTGPYGWSSQRPAPNETHKTSLADPEFENSLIKILKGWGFRY
jgi:hypothetical protein